MEQGNGKVRYLDVMCNVKSYELPVQVMAQVHDQLAQGSLMYGEYEVINSRETEVVNSGRFFHPRTYKQLKLVIEEHSQCPAPPCSPKRLNVLHEDILPYLTQLT